MSIKPIVLGSTSPRRREILEFFSIPFRQVSPDFDENSVPFHGDPVSYAQEVARGKAEVLARQFPHDIILTADTVVHKGGRLFQKPASFQEAHQMLRELAGQKHEVFTGVCIAKGNQQFLEAEKATVEFCQLTDHEIDEYIKTVHTLDKAGGYAIQKGGSLIVKRLEGCYYNIMGLPIQTVRRLLIKVGIDLWHFLKPI
ncbi:MAG: septum formation protein Maf [Verrucomicrobiota bacterium]|nr:septum formation protein Maf [Verrucomicrobiota bacterium]